MALSVAFASEGAVRVLLANGQPMFLSGLRRLLEAQPTLTVVATALNTAEIPAAAAAGRPDVAVIESGLPGGALEAVRLIRLQYPHTRLLLHGSLQDLALIHTSLDAGVTGFIDDTADAGAFTSAVARVAAGELYLPPALVQGASLRRTAGLRPAPRAPRTSLSRREREVLRLIGAGSSNREAAAALGVSLHTVRAHLRSISQKLGVRNRVQAAAAALQLGLLSGRYAADEGAGAERERA